MDIAVIGMIYVTITHCAQVNLFMFTKLIGVFAIQTWLYIAL